MKEVLILSVFVAYMIAIPVINRILDRKLNRMRAGLLKSRADELGFEFHPDGDKDLKDWLSRFRLFSKGRSRKFKNILRGRTCDLDVVVFDYQYTTGYGNYARTYETSVVGFRTYDINLPEFVLRPERFWNRVGVTLFGQQDIDFDTHPVFSKAFLLRGPDETAIRELFTESVLTHFESQSGVSVEAAGGTLLLYRHARLVGPADVRAFLTDGFALLEQFREPGNTSTPRTPRR